MQSLGVLFSTEILRPPGGFTVLVLYVHQPNCCLLSQGRLRLYVDGSSALIPSGFTKEEGCVDVPAEIPVSNRQESSTVC